MADQTLCGDVMENWSGVVPAPDMHGEDESEALASVQYAYPDATPALVVLVKQWARDVWADTQGSMAQAAQAGDPGQDAADVQSWCQAHLGIA
jgi:hypothetical protein